ncbi:MAG: hypothetical protein EKK55_07885 [Rhodocyclaceae bacterium]|nr:MAG: hypothetical protein EKK55_07885 [Rhodocyclaceae bacterium]
MAMTKKEREELESLREQLRIAKALRFTEPVERDVMPPEKSGMTTGWDFNDYTALVDGYNFISELWSKAVSHGSMPYREFRGSQGCVRLFSSKLLALRACRHAVEQKAAKRLADIDKMIEDELAKEGGTV